MNHNDELTCERVFRRLDDFLDRELTEQEMRMVQEHLDICAACAAEQKFQAGVIRELKFKMQRITIPSELMERITRSLHTVGE